MAKGNFIEYVVSDNPNKYPNDGEQSGYYYELYGKPKTVTLISFTIDGTSYQAEEGMTQEEWVASDYNTAGYLYMTNHMDALRTVCTPGSTYADGRHISITYERSDTGAPVIISDYAYTTSEYSV